jgi:hypothetical protein
MLKSILRYYHTGKGSSNGIKTRSSEINNIGMPSLETASRIDDSDKVSAFEAAHYRCAERLRELEIQFEAKASQIRAAFVAEASNIVGSEPAE